MKSIELCSICKEEYIKHHKNHLYCSLECKRVANPQKKPVIVSCTNCGREASFTKGNYDRKKNSSKTIGYFCSKKCEAEYRTKVAVEIRKCENCKKDFSCRKGDKLRFCSISCQGKWQQKYRSGKNHPSYQHDIPDSERIKKCLGCGKKMILEPKEFNVRLTCSKECSLRIQKTTNTIPHLRTQSLLSSLKIKFITEKRIENYFADVYIKRTNLLIEVNGDWWHSSPLLPENKRRTGWEKSALKDNSKQKCLISKGYKILYLWEKDINKSIDLCEKLILLFIKNKGNLKNYHSFNYKIIKNKLTLNDKLLVPIFEIDD